MTDHAPLPPSSAARWVQCGRSVSLSEQYPHEDTDATREGTAAHWVLSERLGGSLHEPGELDLDGTPIDRDMILAANELAASIDKLGLDGDLHTESRLHMIAVHPTDNWGTCDAYLVDHANRVVYVWDYKYGHGYVSEIVNWQMINYAQGVVEAEKLEGNYSFVLTIFQPRYYGREGQLRSVRYTAFEHRQLVHTLHMAAKLVSPNAAARTGPECFHCSGRAACDAFARQVNRIGQVVMRTTPDLPTPALTGLELRWLHEAQKYLKARITALEELVTARPEGTGYVLEQGYGREKWTITPEEVHELGNLMDLKLAGIGWMLTPAQAVKLGLDPEVKAEYSVKPKGAVSLVPLDKSRVVAAFEEE